MNALEIHGIATDVANCTFGGKKVKRKTRQNILKTIVLAIDSAQSDPSVLTELRNMVEYGGEW